MITTNLQKRESQISNAISRLDKNIAELEDIAAEHEGRICSVLRDGPQLKGGDCDVEQREVKVELATTVDKFSDRVYSIIDRMNSIQSRLEL